MPKTTEQNRIVRTGKSEAEVTINKNCARSIILLKLSIYRHEASSGFFATAELLVLFLLKSAACAAIVIGLLLFCP